eukprot:g35485.t1
MGKQSDVASDRSSESSSPYLQSLSASSNKMLSTIITFVFSPFPFHLNSTPPYLLPFDMIIVFNFKCVSVPVSGLRL